jgi:hypothetical protein
MPKKPFLAVCTFLLAHNFGWAQQQSSSAEAQKKPLVAITPAFAFAWYPVTNFYNEWNGSEGGGITNHDSFLDMKVNSNFATTYQVSLSLFDKISTGLNLDVEYPFIGKLSSIAGHINGKRFGLKINTHFLNGTGTWNGDKLDTPAAFNFQEKWTSAVLLYKFNPTLSAGIYYNNRSMPAEILPAQSTELYKIINDDVNEGAGAWTNTLDENIIANIYGVYFSCDFSNSDEPSAINKNNSWTPWFMFDLSLGFGTGAMSDAGYERAAQYNAGVEKEGLAMGVIADIILGATYNIKIKGKTFFSLSLGLNAAANALTTLNGTAGLDSLVYSYGPISQIRMKL